MGGIISKVTDAIGLTDIEGTRERGEKAAREQREAARLGAEVSAFRPVGMTTRFGTAGFDVTDVGGVPRVTGARYEVSPELKAIQDALMALTGGAVGTATGAAGAVAPLGDAARGLFNLGAGYIAESPEAARQRIFNELQAARQPAQEREEQRLASTVFGRGRAGLNIGSMGQPELFALGQAREEQRAKDIVAANEQAKNEILFGTGLFGSGAGLLESMYGIPTKSLSNLQALLGTVGSIEELGQDPFNLGLAVGGAAQPGATAGANLLSAGLSNAASTTRAAGDAASGQLTNFMGGMLKSAIGGFGGAGGGFGGMTSAFSQTGLGSSGFGTGLAYGNRDYGTYF
jgi:hypothetical protein